MNHGEEETRGDKRRKDAAHASIIFTVRLSCKCGWIIISFGGKQTKRLEANPSLLERQSEEQQKPFGKDDKVRSGGQEFPNMNWKITMTIHAISISFLFALNGYSSNVPFTLAVILSQVLLIQIPINNYALLRIISSTRLILCGNKLEKYIWYISRRNLIFDSISNNEGKWRNRRTNVHKLG